MCTVPGHAGRVAVLVQDDLYMSDDGGFSWEPLHPKTTFPLGYHRGMTVRAGESPAMFLTLGDWTPGTTGTVMRSVDDGRSWEEVPLPVPPNSAMWVVSAPLHDPDVVFAASRYGYLYRSDDAGLSWRKLWREFSEISSVVWLP
jgi:photosystem II stability/assembly factor-like uncharacterized protein